MRFALFILDLLILYILFLSSLFPAFLAHYLLSCHLLFQISNSAIVSLSASSIPLLLPSSPALNSKAISSIPLLLPSSARPALPSLSSQPLTALAGRLCLALEDAPRLSRSLLISPLQLKAKRRCLIGDRRRLHVHWLVGLILRRCFRFPVRAIIQLVLG